MPSVNSQIAKEAKASYVSDTASPKAPTRFRALETIFDLGSQRILLQLGVKPAGPALRSAPAAAVLVTTSPNEEVSSWHEAGVFGAAANRAVYWGFKRSDQHLEYDAVRDPEQISLIPCFLLFG